MDIGTKLQAVSLRDQGYTTLTQADLFRQIFDRNQAVQLLIDPASGRIVEANSAACAFYGRFLEELTSLSIGDINALARAQVSEALEQAAAGKRSRFLFKHQLPSGETRDVEVHWGPVEVGGRGLVFSIVHDVSDRARAEDAFEQVSQAFAAALDGMAIVGADDTYVFLNEAHARAYGYERTDELLGKSWRLLYEPAGDPSGNKGPFGTVVVVLETGLADGNIDLTTVAFTQPPKALALLLEGAAARQHERYPQHTNLHVPPVFGTNLVPVGSMLLLFSQLLILAERWSTAIDTSEQTNMDLRRLLDVNISISSEMRLDALLKKIVSF